MEIFETLKAALKEHPDSYVSHAQMADCMVCGEHKDLRCGACFDCCEKVTGKPIKNLKGATIGHQLWAKDNPDKKWITGT